MCFLEEKGRNKYWLYAITIPRISHNSTKCINIFFPLPLGSFCQLNKTTTCFDWADFFYLGVQHGWYDIMDHHGLSCDVLWKCFHLFEQTVQSSPYTQTLAAPINDCIWFPDFSDHAVRRADGTVWERADSFVGERALTLLLGVWKQRHSNLSLISFRILWAGSQGE